MIRSENFAHESVINASEIKTITSNGLQKMLRDATNVYGDRPVFVDINGKTYIITDMRFTAHGKDYVLLLS